MLPSWLAGMLSAHAGPGDTVQDLLARSTGSSPPRRARLNLETLEDRTALAAWTLAGPAPTLNGQTSPASRVSGAVQAIAPHPTNPNIAYVGATNGGIWRTNNLTAPNPTWTPLGDRLPGMSIGDIALDPANPNVVLVGMARRSAYFGDGDVLRGMYYSTNGGTTFTLLGAANIQNQNFLSVASRGNTLFGASFNGLFRSTDRGATWTNISGSNNLPAGAVLNLAGDPGNPNRFYAAVSGAGGGIFRTNNLGATWTDVTAGITEIGATTGNMKMSVHNSAGNNVVYLSIVNNNTLAAVYRSTNQGGAWTALDLPTVNPGTQGDIHSSLVAHPTNPNLVYVGGDRLNAAPFTGNLVRIDASQATGSQITAIVDAGASNTSPHADSRDMAFSANGLLLEGDDGGIFRLTNPAGTGRWTSAVGNLAIYEVHSIAYDSLSNTVLVGAQDNGTNQQQGPGPIGFNQIFGGDGGDVAIDSVTNRAQNQFIRYYSAQNLGGFTREVVNASTFAIVNTTQLSTANVTDPQFVTPVELNSIDPRRLIIGGSGTIYESLNQGTTITAIANSPGANVDALVYGGSSGGTANLALIYVGSNNQVLRRTTAGGAFTALALPAGATTVNDVAINPTRWQTVFAVDDNRVYMSNNAGATWQIITGNLGAVSQLRNVTVNFVPAANAIVVGTRSGVYVARMSAPTVWSQLGTALPNVPVYDLAYNRTDDTLIAGTLGRGGWILRAATNAILNPGGGGGGGGGGGTPGLVFNPDTNEPNNTSDKASNLGFLSRGTQQLTRLSIRRTPLGLPDYDWYRFKVNGNGVLTIQLTVRAGQQLELSVFGRSASTLQPIGRRQQTPVGQSRSISVRVRTGHNIYFEVKGVNIAPGVITEGNYSLTLTLT